METFSHFEIFNYAGKRMVEGHKVGRLTVKIIGSESTDEIVNFRLHSVWKTTSAREWIPSMIARTMVTR